MIYVSHPYGGLEENKERVERIVTALSELYPNITFVSPIHCFGFMYYTTPYKNGLNYCIELLTNCEGVLVCGDYLSSVECSDEVRICIKQDTPYTILPNNTTANCNVCCYKNKCDIQENCERLVNATSDTSIETDLNLKMTCKRFVNVNDLGNAMEILLN